MTQYNKDNNQGFNTGGFNRSTYTNKQGSNWNTQTAPIPRRSNGWVPRFNPQEYPTRRSAFDQVVAEQTPSDFQTNPTTVTNVPQQTSFEPPLLQKSKRSNASILGNPILNASPPVFPFETQNQDLLRKLIWTITAVLKQFFIESKLVVYKMAYPGDTNRTMVNGYSVVILDLKTDEPDFGTFCLTLNVDTASPLAGESRLRWSMKKLKSIRHELSHQQFSQGFNEEKFQEACTYAETIADVLMSKATSTRLQDYIEMKKRVIANLQTTFAELKEMRENRSKVSNHVNDYNKARIAREILQSDVMKSEEMINFLVYCVLPRSNQLMDEVIKK